MQLGVDSPRAAAADWLEPRFYEKVNHRWFTWVGGGSSALVSDLHNYPHVLVC